MAKRLQKTAISFLIVLLAIQVLICSVRSETGESLEQAVEGTTEVNDVKRATRRYPFREPCFMARCVRRRSSSKKSKKTQNKVEYMKDISLFF